MVPRASSMRAGGREREGGSGVNLWKGTRRFVDRFNSGTRNEGWMSMGGWEELITEITWWSSLQGERMEGWPPQWQSSGQGRGGEKGSWVLCCCLVTQSCPPLCDPKDYSAPGLPVHNQLLESTHTHVHWVGDAIQPSHPLPSPSPFAFHLSQHQGLLQWADSSHQVAKALELQLQHQS